MLTLFEFIQKNDGKKVGNTPENLGECVGCVSVWMDNLGIPHEWGNANDLLKNADLNYFDVISNTPDAIPQQGDVVVWNGNYNGSVGHTGIATGQNTDINKFECFEQNDPLGSPCHLREYTTYAYIDGWLRPKVVQLPQPIPAPILTEQTKYNFGGDIGIQEMQAVRSIIMDTRKQVSTISNNLSVTQKSLNEVNSKLADAITINNQQAGMLAQKDQTILVLNQKILQLQNTPNLPQNPPQNGTGSSLSPFARLLRFLGLG